MNGFHGRNWIRASWLFALAVGSALPLPCTGDEPPAYGLQYMARYGDLPLFKLGVGEQASSYNRQGRNADSGNFVRREGGTAVLAELDGPGCVYRLWSANPRGTLRMFFDGEATPRIECEFQALFSGKVAPFVAPLVGRSSGGWYCLFPIPYEKHLRIEVEGAGGLFYQVQYRRLPAGTAVRTFTTALDAADAEALQKVLKEWSSVREGFDGPAVETVELKPGEKATRPFAGGGTIRRMLVRIDPADRQTLRDVVLRAWWDGADRPAVEAPLGDFFGAGFGPAEFYAQPLASDGKSMLCRFPMPFARSARLEIANESDRPIKLAWTVDVDRAVPDMTQAGYFHTKWRHIVTEFGKPVNLLMTTGRGHFVGVTLNMQGSTHARHDLWFLEGDEQIYVDGQTAASIHGTGLEDYFSAGWYFNGGLFSLPYHGLTVKDYAHSRIAAYRFQLADCVPFTKSIRVDIEHGGTNDYPGADYWWCAYWYQDQPADDYPAMESAERRRPVSIRWKNVTEAEQIRSIGREIDDFSMPIELSASKAVRTDADGRAVLRLSADQPGAHYLALGVLCGPGEGVAEVAVAGRAIGQVNAQADQLALRRVVLGPVELVKGRQELAFQAAGDFAVDSVQLYAQKARAPLEGEWLPVAERSSGTELIVQKLTDMGNRWSNQAQLQFRADRPGQFITLELTVRQAGRHRIGVRLARAGDYGRVKLRLDGTDVPGQFDGYAGRLTNSPTNPIGTFDLAAGTHKLTFTVAGKNERSRGYAVGIDAITLEPVP